MLERFGIGGGARLDGGFVAATIDPDGVAVVAIQQRGMDRPKLHGLAISPPFEDGADAKRLQAELLEDVIHGMKLERTPVTTVVSPDDYQLLLVEAPDVPPEELRAAIRWRIKDLIDFHLDDAVIDVFELSGQAQRRGARMMYAVAAREAAVRERVEIFDQTSLQLEVIDIPELCLRNIAAQVSDGPLGVAVLYLLRTHGHLVLCNSGQLSFARRLDIGIDALTGVMTDGIRKTVDDLVLEIQRSVDYAHSHFGGASISRLLITPSDPQVPGLMEAVSAGLDLEVEQLDLNDLIESDELLDYATQARVLLAVGAALRQEEATL